MAGARTRGRGSLGLDTAMVALAVASILLLLAQHYRWLGPDWDRRLLYIDLGVVAVFWAEYLWRLAGHPDKRAFIAGNWYEIPGMVPIFPGMQQFAGLRFLRLLRVLRVLRLVGALRRFEGFERTVELFTRRSRLGYVALLALGVVGGGAAVAWAVEPATFPNYGDALWWAAVTAATVGYGDFVPVSGPGRAAGVVLMLLGVGLIGTLAATMSSFLVERRFQEESRDRSAQGRARLGDAPVPGFGIAAELERLARLHQNSELSDAEYAAAKDRVLGR